MATLPITFAQEGWYTSSFIAARLNRPIRTIQHWCKTGFFTKRGCKVICVRNLDTPRCRYWIHIPPTLMSTDAMMLKIALDIPIRIAIPFSLGQS